MGLADNGYQVQAPQAPGVQPNPRPQGPAQYQGLDPSQPQFNGKQMFRGDNDVPIPLYTGYMGDKGRLINKFGTITPKGFDLPKVRVPGVDFNRQDFEYGGVTQNQWNNQGAQMANRAAPTTDYKQADVTRNMGLAGGLGGLAQAQNMYSRMATGEGPSLANLQLQQGVDKGMASQMAMANSMRGGGLARSAAMQGAQMAGGAMQNQAVNQAAQQRMNEQMQGMQGLASTSSAYGQMAGQMSAQDAQRAQYLSQLQLQSRGQNDQTMMGLYGLGMQSAGADQSGRQAYATTQGNADYNTQVANANIEAGKAAGEMQLGQGMSQGGGGALGGLFAGIFGA